MRPPSPPSRQQPSRRAGMPVAQHGMADGIRSCSIRSHSMGWLMAPGATASEATASEATAWDA
eukprot:1157035-Pelagomonas_calceolata.AAC.3